MPSLHRLLLASFFATSTLAGGCANREYVTPNVLLSIRENDPEFKKLRVYPNQTFVVVYTVALGQETGVSGEAGTVESGFRGQRVEVPVRRTLPGAIVALEDLNGQPLLWVTFNEKCTTPECAYGFVQSNDGLFRLYRVPRRKGYAAPLVYRKRIARRKTMERTKIYSKTDDAAVYFTLRGFSLSVGLEVKKRSKVDIETVVDPDRGVAPIGR